MPQEPKKRHSRQRQGKRRANIHLALKKAIVCPNCNEPALAHSVCKKCGYYKGAQIIVKKEKKKKEE
jgi:large subunit ribosomal protein L32